MKFGLTVSLKVIPKLISVLNFILRNKFGEKRRIPKILQERQFGLSSGASLT